MSSTLPAVDNLFRGAHHPVSFNKRDIFKYGKFMKLFNDNNPRFIEASFILERFAPTLTYVHAYGCRTSSRRNARNLTRRDVYCGAYQLKVRDIRDLAVTDGLPEIAMADVIHAIEDNEIAHGSFQVRLKEDIVEDDIEDVKTAIADRLWNKSRGPLAHHCRVDCDLDPHPSTNLPPAPLGRYNDDRALVARWSSLARFFWSRLVWNIRSRLVPGKVS